MDDEQKMDGEMEATPADMPVAEEGMEMPETETTPLEETPEEEESAA